MRYYWEVETDDYSTVVLTGEALPTAEAVKERFIRMNSNNVDVRSSSAGSVDKYKKDGGIWVLDADKWIDAIMALLADKNQIEMIDGRVTASIGFDPPHTEYIGNVEGLSPEQLALIINDLHAVACQEEIDSFECMIHACEGA